MQINMRSIHKLLLMVVSVVTFSTKDILAADWPQFRGPDRNGISGETGLKKSWPANGPELLWSFEGLGSGYSSASIVADNIYITGEIDKQETLFALDAKGNLKWKTVYGSRWTRSHPEVRTTPTVDGDLLYVISGLGNVACIEAASGKIRWQVQVAEKYGAEYHRWGIAESPLLVDDKVIVTPGGNEVSLVALHKDTGEQVWASDGIGDKSNYCSPILIEHGGKKIIATMLENSFVGIDAANGKYLWQDKYSDYFGDHKAINPVSPVYYEGLIYTTSGYDDGGALFELSADGTSIKRLWVDKTLDVHHGGVVIVDGYIYGANWLNNREGNWVCIELRSGKVMYEQPWQTKGSIIYADGLLYCYEEKRGHIALVRPNPKTFEVVSSFVIPLGSKQHWAHPAISDGRLFVRHGEALMVYDIREDRS
jgi:outer membrane protein assembly factor BamB